MSKINKKLLSLLLSTMMVFSVVPSTVYAAPDQGTEATVEQDANKEAKPVEDNTVTVSGTDITIPAIQFKGANAALAEALTKDVKIDEDDPAIQSLREALGDLEMVGGEAGTESNESNIGTADLYEADEADGQGETKKLTGDQINTVVGMYQNYLNQWSANANVLGVRIHSFWISTMIRMVLVSLVRCLL